jgi:hypothetical protein
MTHDQAQDKLARVAHSVVQATEAEACAKFLERIANDPDAEILRAALVDAGATAVLRQAVAGEQQHVAHTAQEVAGIAQRIGQEAGR